jgi:hypothetical protein
MGRPSEFAVPKDVKYKIEIAIVYSTGVLYTHFNFPQASFDCCSEITKKMISYGKTAQFPPPWTLQRQAA